MDNFSTRSPIDYYYNQDRRWDLSDLEDSQGEDGSDEENNQLNDFKLRVKDKYIVVSSLDRDWANSSIVETPYNFTVMCGVSSKSSHAKLPELPKNIKSFKIHKMVLPNKELSLEIRTSNVKTSIHNDPYLSVNVGGFNSLHNGSNKNIDLASGIMITLTPLANANYKSIEFKNINDSKTTFDINPLSNINSLKININNSIGFPPTTNIRDILRVWGVKKDNVSPNVVIQILTYFTDEFQVGDRILIKNYKTSITGSDKTIIRALKFNDFINREEGHIIIGFKEAVSTGNPGGNGYNNCIVILPELDHTTLDGFSSYVERMAYYDSIISGTNPINLTDKLQNVEGENYKTAKLINVNLQSHLFINLESLEKENVVGGQLI
jgi:hypothetical protein